MIDTRKAINLADLRPEELEPRLELQILSFDGSGTSTDPGLLPDGSGTSTNGGLA